MGEKTMSLERFYNPVIRPFSLNITNLPGAKLYFYESGSSTPKAVYQDKFGITPHTNPVVADSSGSFAPIFLDGLYRVTLTDSSDVVQAGYPVDNIGNDSDNAVFGPWSETYSYAINDIVYGSDNNWYKSITASNLGNDPTTSPEEWSEIPFFGFYNQYETYNEDDVAFYENRIWVSLQDDNTGNTPATGSAWWESTTGGTAAERDVKDAGESYSATDIPSAGLTEEIIRDQQAYKGPWEDQSGQAAPPYLVDYGAGSNDLLQSESLDNASWTKFEVLSTTDSGIAAPAIKGQTFGNYWKVVPSTVSAAHSILQVVSPAAGPDVSILVNGGDYDYLFFRIDNASSVAIYQCVINMSSGEVTQILNPSNYDLTVVDYGAGDWLVSAASLVGTAVGRVVFQPRETEISSVFAGNGTDGILLTRAHMSKAGARYAKTTTTSIAYTPPKLYQLLEPLEDVTATEPGTDNDIWQEIGSGGGIVYAGTQTYTSADEDGSDNIAIDVDFSLENWVDIDVSDASISTSGAYQLDITGLQTDEPATYTIHFKGAAVKSSVTYALPGSWTADWHATPTYEGAGGTTAAKRAGHTYITIQTDPLAGENANFSLGDSRSY